MRKPFAVIGFSMIFAMTMSIFLGMTLSLFAGVLSGGCFLALLVIHKRNVFHRYAIWSVSLITVALAFLLTAVVTHILTQPVKQYAGETAVIEGQILDYPRKAHGRYYYEVKIKKIQLTDKEEEGASFKIRLSSLTPIVADPYDSIRCEATFYRFASDFGLSSESSYLADGIIMGAYSRFAGWEVIPAESKPILYYFKQFRHELTKGIRVLLPPEQAGIVNAILLGERDGISEEMNAAFRGSGITHLIVISGMHMALISALLQWILKLLKFSRKWQSILTIVGIVLFMLLIGTGPSILRSGIMIIVVLLADMLGREVDRVNSLGLALTLMCFANPMIGGDVGFLLSVFATLGICVLYPRMDKHAKQFCDKIPHVGGLIHLILSALLISIAANAFILPLQVYIFKEFTFSGILATILLTIPSTVLLYSGAMICLLLIPGVTAMFAAPLQFLAIRCADIIIWTANFFSQASFFRLYFYGGSGLIVLICALILFGIVLLIGKTGKKMILAATACILMLVLGYGVDHFRYRDVVKVAISDQGEDSTVVIMRNNEASVLSLSGYRTYAAAELLSKNRITKLHTMVLSDDGYEGIKAASEVFGKYAPEAIWGIEDFYPNNNILPYMTDYKIITEETEIELLDGVYGELRVDGGLFFTLENGTTFFVGNESEINIEVDILITGNKSFLSDAELCILQTDDIIEVDEIFALSGRYLLAGESDTTYIDCYQDGTKLIRREN